MSNYETQRDLFIVLHKKATKACLRSHDDLTTGLYLITSWMRSADTPIKVVTDLYCIMNYHSKPHISHNILNIETRSCSK